MLYSTVLLTYLDSLSPFFAAIDACYSLTTSVTNGIKSKQYSNPMYHAYIIHYISSYEEGPQLSIIMHALCKA